MNIKWFIKFVTLSIALGFTLFSIYLLNTQHVPDFLNSLGFSQNQTFNWCVERVLKIESLSEQKWSLYEDQQKWWIIRGEQPPAEMNYLAVEKWFAQYCSIEIEELKSEKIFDLPMTHLARVIFNNSSTATMHWRGGDIYQINQTVYESREMTEALASLRSLLALNH